MHLKDFQISVLEKLSHYLEALRKEYQEEQSYKEFKESKGEVPHLEDYPRKTWEKLEEAQKLPVFEDEKRRVQNFPYLDKLDGMGNSIPNICLKVPTGGGKTLLGASSVEIINADYFFKNTGLVLWIVPTEAIYRQTIKNFKDRNHPYRNIFERSAAGRFKILEKTSSFSIQDLQNQLCVMLIMLQSANRETKESLRVFKDSGLFIDFFPQPNDHVGNKKLLSLVRNLDIYKDDYPLGGSEGVVIKHSLGNAIRVARPIIILDEGHRAYSDLARNTICDLNPKFILELSATPNMTKGHLSNVLVSVPGVKLKEEEMIKLPINVANCSGDWKNTLCQAYERVKDLERDSRRHYKNSNSYIRPIMLIQVERTGKEQRNNKYIHSEDVKEYLIKRLAVQENSIKIKTAEKNELKDESLLSEASQVQFIITKQALQEGWDCPFAYVLTILSNAQSKSALTQLIGRILRQPYAQITPIDALNQSYVFCYNETVAEIVGGIRKGLQQEGMNDLIDHVIISDKESKKIKIKRKKPFQNVKIFLPRVLHKDGESWRNLIYGEDILKDIDFSKISYRKKDTFTLDNSNPVYADIIKIDLENNIEQMSPSHVTKDKQKQSIEMDYAYMVGRLSNMIPNPWEASRILEETITVLKDKKISDEKIYLNRSFLLHSIETDVEKQIFNISEKIFKNKLFNGDICFKIFKDSIDFNWKMPSNLEFVINTDTDKILRRKNDENLQLSLFEETYKKDYNEYEKKVAWYLDEREAIRWWHRMATKQDYYLQGWQKRKVWPDFLAYVDTNDGRVNNFTVLETKGDHLKGNEDTEYKQKLFDLLEKYANNPIDIGEVETASKDEEKIVFKILMEQNWQEDIQKVLQ